MKILKIQLKFDIFSFHTLSLRHIRANKIKDNPKG